MSVTIVLLKKVRSTIKLVMFQEKWRKFNKHNYTTASRIFPMNIVEVGKMTYGPLDIHSWGNEEEKLIIGDLVSISSGVKFLLGGNHRIDTVSTYPFKVKVMGEESEATTKGPVIVGDDVWIGMDAMILSGVTIGKGAVVAARSVITKDIPPFAIVAGNPAKIIKYRFTEDLLETLVSSNNLSLDKEFVEREIENLYTKLDQNILEKLTKGSKL